MKRSIFLRNTGLTLAGLAFMHKNSLASFFDDPAWKIRMLSDEIGIFTEKGGTIAFCITKDGITVVDSQFPDTSVHLIEALKKKTETPFSLLINTHHHGDHTSGNIAYKGLVKHVLAHENSKANQERVAKEQKKEDVQLFPDQTYASTWCGKSGKENICLHYFGAGHTNGDSIVHFENSNIIHLGDLVFNRRHPYIDKTAGADIASWIKVLDKTIKTFDKKTQYICGHSGNGYETILKEDDLKAFAEYLENLLNVVGKEIKAGKTQTEILQLKEIPGSPEWKGEGIERPLKAAFQELST